VKRFRGGLVFKAHRLLYHVLTGENRRAPASRSISITSASSRILPTRVAMCCEGQTFMTVLYYATTVLCYASTVLYYALTVIYYALTVLYYALTVLYYALTVLYYALTVLYYATRSRSISITSASSRILPTRVAMCCQRNVCVREKERERESERESVCDREIERERVCVCSRERAREFVCVCVRERGHQGGFAIAGLEVDVGTRLSNAL